MATTSGPEVSTPTVSVNTTLSADTTKSSLIVGRRRRVTIVMFSGGIDSTYTLVRMLRETNDQIVVHHIHFINNEDRYRIEAERARKIVDYCQAKYRPFTYSESALDHRCFRFYGYDMVGVGFEAGLVAHSYQLQYGRIPDRWTIGSCVEEGRNPTRWPHVLACVAANCWPHQPPEYFGFPVPRKADEIAYLPDEILDLSWTCRRPVWKDGRAEECGTCKTCQTMEAIRAGDIPGSDSSQPT